MKTLTLVVGAILALALGGCADDPVNRNIAILQSPASTPEQKAAARRFLEWKLAQNERDLEFQRQMELARASRPVYAPPVDPYQQAQLDRIEAQTAELKQQMDYQRVQAENATPPQPSASPFNPWGGHW